ncbi:MAG: hypothetical protein KIT79_05040 [Deltaproteobacteria bacterium]|nr:hypothetical protein [Deltaproteobacteria bacterium]
MRTPGWATVYIFSIFIMTGVLLAGSAAAQEPADDGIVYGTARRQNYWLGGLRAGLSLVPAKVAYGGVKADPGPHVNASFARVIDDIVAIGLMSEWESHDLKVGGLKAGTGHVVSIIPYAEARARLTGSKVVLTGSFGLGANINFFDMAPGVTPKVKPNPMVAFRLAVGGEYEVKENAFLGLEIAYKTNNAKAEIGNLGKDNYRYNSLAFLFGGKLAF